MNMVIGGASIPSKNITKYLQEAFKNNIREIDSAPSYLNEKKIGNSFDLKLFKINTKIGNTKYNFDVNGISMSLKKSILDLKIDQVNILFVHSLPVNQISTKIQKSLLKFRDCGYTKYIGYSGDGEQVYLAKRLGIFDFFQVTLNPLDLGNAKYIEINNETIYLKRIFASGIWNSSSRVRKEFLARKIIPRDYNAYFERLNIISKGLNRKLDLYYYSRFLSSYAPLANKIIGTQSLKHLLKAKNMLDDGLKNNLDCRIMDEHLELYFYLMKKYNYSIII